MQPSAGERIGVVEQRLYADQGDWKLGWPEDEHGTAVPWIRYARLAPTSRTTTAPSATITCVDGHRELPIGGHQRVPVDGHPRRYAV